MCVTQTFLSGVCMFCIFFHWFSAGVEITREHSPEALVLLLYVEVVLPYTYIKPELDWLSCTTWPSKSDKYLHFGMEASVAALTVDIDEHVLGGALPEVAQARYTIQGSGMMRPGPMDSEALPDIEGDLWAIHCHLHWRELTVQCYFGFRWRHLAGEDRRPVGPQLNHLIVVRWWHKQLLWV